MLSRCGSLERETPADSRTMAALAGVCQNLDGIPERSKQPPPGSSSTTRTSS